MNPIEFEGSRPLNPAKGTENRVRPLPFVTDGFNCISFWEFTDKDWDDLVAARAEGKTTGVWVSVNSGDRQPPVLLSVARLKPMNLYCCMLLYYKSEIINQSVFVWNSIDDAPPPVIEIDGVTLFLKVDLVKPTFHPDYPLEAGKLYFRYLTPEEGLVRKQKMLDEIGNIRNIDKDKKEEYLKNIDEMAFSLPGLVKKLQAGAEEVIC